MKKRLVVGNWKMYITSADTASEFALMLRKKARGLSGAEVLIAPSFTLIPVVADVLASSSIRVGAQALSSYTDEKHTGDVSGAMLRAAGASFVIVGHSERRAAGDTDALVHAQLENAISAKLMPILCVGELERTHEADHFSFVEEQLNTALMGIPKNLLKKLVVAYEPVWAIGKSAADAMKPSDVQEMTIFIRKILTEILDRKMAQRTPVLYGGSVEPDNAPTLLKEGDVSGFLVGHASTNVDSFVSILKAVR
ncbi:MAG TPA: triose-phosphate isomerase [Candidatus Paceibacterota bacterium]|nr:triose-phosphate isomerase [Candidatus Paceibacterota bacterium]